MNLEQLLMSMRSNPLGGVPTPGPTLEEILGQQLAGMPPRMPSVPGQVAGMMPEPMGPHIVPQGPGPLPMPMPGPQLPVFATGNTGASLAASGAPMPTGLPIPRPQAAAIPGLGTGPMSGLPSMPAMPDMRTSAIGQFLTQNVDPSLAAPVSPLMAPQGSAAEFLQQMLGGAIPTRTGKTYAENITVGPGSSSPSQGASAGGPPAAPPPRFGLPAPSTPGAGTTTRTMTIGGPSGEPMARYASAIKGIESGGRYDIVGPRHEKLGRALGAYQVMEANVGPWTKDAIGRAMTPEEFLADPKAQDAVFQHRFGQYVEKFGNPQDAASAWFTGKPLAQGAGSKDVLGTTGQSYVDKFNAALGQVGDSNPMPGVPDYKRTVLPTPEATTPLKGLPANAFDQFNQLGVTRPPPRNPVDNIVAILGAMSGAAAGAKNAGDLLAAVGGAAGGQASRNINLSREEGKEFSQREDQLKRFMAEIGVRKAEAETQGQNYQIEAANRDKTLLNTVATEQAKLDTAAKNRVAELKNEIDWKKWERFEPQIKVDKDGVTIVKRKPDGSMDITSTRGQDMDAQAERMRNAATVYGKDSQTVDALQYQALAQGPLGETAVRRQIMKDMVDRGMAIDVLGPEQYKALEKEATKGLDLSLQGRPEFDAQKKQRMLDLLWGQLQGRDEVWLPKLLQKGHIGAAMLARPAGG